MMKMGFRLALVTSLLLGLGMQAVPAQASPAPEVIYRVQLASPDSAGIQVETDIPATQGVPLHLGALQDYAGGRVSGLASHYTLTGAHDGTGQSLQVSGDPGDWTVSAPGDGQVTVSYLVNLNGYQAEPAFADAASGGAPWPYFPISSEGFLYLPGYSVFLYPDSLRDTGTARIYLQLPDGWTSAAPLESADGAFVASWQEMTGNLFLGGTGDLFLKLGSAAGKDLTLALAPGAGPTNVKSRDESFGRLSAMAEQAAGILNQQGGSGKFLLLYAFGNEGQAGGLPPYEEVASFGSSATIALPADSNILSLDSTEFMARAAFRFLAGRALDGQPVPQWFRDGTAGYYQLALPFQAGLISGNDFWDRFDLIYTDYQVNPESQSLALDAATSRLPDPAAGRFIEEKGAVLAASIDQRIRDVTGNRYSLDDLVKRLSGTDGYNPGTPDEAGLQANLESLTGVSWKDFFEQNVKGTALIKASSFSNLKSLSQQSNNPAGQPVQSGPAKSWSWVFVVLATLLIFAIPVLLEPYTLKPRKRPPAPESDS